MNLKNKIIYDTEIKPLERLILMDIVNQLTRGKVIDMSNQEIAEKFKVSTGTVSRAISIGQKKGYIDIKRASQKSPVRLIRSPKEK